MAFTHDDGFVNSLMDRDIVSVLNVSVSGGLEMFFLERLGLVSVLRVQRLGLESLKQVAQLSQRDRAAVWVSRGPNINIVFHIQKT